MADDFDDWLNRFAEDRAQRQDAIGQADERREELEVLLTMDFGDLVRETIKPVFKHVASKIDGASVRDEPDRITVSMTGRKRWRKLSFAANARNLRVQLESRSLPLSGSTKDLGTAVQAGWQVLGSWQANEIDQQTVKTAIREFLEQEEDAR